MLLHVTWLELLKSSKQRLYFQMSFALSCAASLLCSRVTFQRSAANPLCEILLMTCAVCILSLCIHIYIYIDTHAYVYIYIYTHISISLSLYIYIYIYIYILRIYLYTCIHFVSKKTRPLANLALEAPELGGTRKSSGSFPAILSRTMLYTLSWVSTRFFVCFCLFDSDESFCPDSMPCVVLWKPEALDCRVLMPPQTWSNLRTCLFAATTSESYKAAQSERKSYYYYSEYYYYYY